MNSALHAIFLLPALLLAGARGAAPHAPQPSGAAQDIRRVDFKNFTYTRKTQYEDDGRPPVVVLRRQRYVNGDGAEVFLMRLAYGDLTGDGREEAALVLRGQNTRISRTLDEVFLYGMDGSEAALIANFDGGRRGDYIFGVTIEAGLLKIDLAVMPDCPEGDGVPRQYRSLVYRLEDGRVVEVERAPLREIPEHLKEVG